MKRKPLKSYYSRKLVLFALTSVVAGVLFLLLAFKIAPWYSAVDTRVRLYLTAPSQVQMDICWDKKQAECMPLVPYVTEKNHKAEPGENANVWLAELPPRPKYTISFVFNSPFDEAKLDRLDIDSSHVLLFGSSRGVGIPDIQFSKDKFELQGITSKTVGQSSYLAGSAGAKLLVRQDIIPGPDKGPIRWVAIRTIWGMLFSIYLIIAVPAFMLPELAANVGSAKKFARSGRYPGWLFLVFAATASGMLFLVNTSGVIFNQYDPLGYLYLALGGGWFSDARLPGYPLFLGFTLWLSQFKLEGVILFQAAIFCGAIGFCIWVLRKWIHPAVAVGFIILSLFSPSQIHWARWILRESLFASLILISITAVIAHFTSRRPSSTIWLGVFTLTCGVAFLVRENGILLPAALLPFLIPQTICIWKDSTNFWHRFRATLFLGLRYCTPVIVIGAIYLGFSYYNLAHYGYFQVGLHQTSHATLAKVLYPANGDARSLLTPGASVNKDAQDYYRSTLYDAYIVGRDQMPGLDPIYAALYPVISQHMSERNEPINSFHIGFILNEIGKGMNAYVPWEANAAGLLRQYCEIITIKNAAGYYPFQVVDPSTFPEIQKALDQYPLSRPVKANMMSAPEGIVAWYYKATSQYPWYGILLILAALFSIYIVKYGDPIFLAPAALFIANCCLLVFTRLVTNRYLVSLDMLLILQTVLGVSLLINRHFGFKTDPI